MFVQLPNGQIFKFLGFSSLQPSENAACIYYTFNNQDTTRAFKLQIDNHQDVGLFDTECYGYSEEDIRLIQQRIMFGLKNHDEIVVIPTPEEVSKLNDGVYCLLFNTISDTEDGNEHFQKLCDRFAKAIANKEIDVTTLIPITLYGDPTKYDIEWITNMMLSAKIIRVALNSETNTLWKIVHLIALKHGLDVQSTTKNRIYISGIPVTKNI